jgi:NAD(P)-dependent dehydrogenase (short-subunit alcohol dehydrogenase family)
MDLQDRHVVVTGAGRGIGAALARRFHAGGARVTIADLAGAADVAAGLGERAVGITADVASEAGNVTLIEQAEAAFGPVDLFFANAGIGGGTDLASTSEDAWQQTFDINVNAHRWAAKHLLPGWLAAGEGYFCSTASAAGLLAQIGSAPYTVTKRAAVAFAEWLAITYGDRGLRVSCLCPQGVNTEMLRGSEQLGGGASVVRSAGDVLEPEVVADIVADAIAAERFLILPHPQVQQFMQRKADDPDRWLAGMRKLQARVLG